MSQSTAKAERRQIRRAVGPEAVDAINSHADSLTQLIVCAKAHGENLAALGRRLDTEHEFTLAQGAVLREHDGILNRGFWGRLRWLVFGQ